MFPPKAPMGPPGMSPGGPPDLGPGGPPPMAPPPPAAPAGPPGLGSMMAGAVDPMHVIQMALQNGGNVFILNTGGETEPGPPGSPADMQEDALEGETEDDEE